MGAKVWMVGIVAGGLLLAGAVQAAPQVEGPWIRLAPPSAPMLAGYGVLRNAEGRERALVAARSPAFGDIELHETVERDGVARMLEQERITVPARGERALRPGSFHLMLMRPHAPLEKGEEVAITLVFDGGDEREVVFTVREDGDGARRHHEHHEHHHHH